MNQPKLNRRGRRFARKIKRKFPRYYKLIEDSIFIEKLKRTKFEEEK